MKVHIKETCTMFIGLWLKFTKRIIWNVKDKFVNFQKHVVPVSKTMYCL